MSDDASEPPPTGRPKRRLLRALALPWLVYGGLLWAIWAMIPETPYVLPQDDIDAVPSGLTARILAPIGPGWIGPRGVLFVQNPRGSNASRYAALLPGERFGTPDGGTFTSVIERPRSGLFWRKGVAPLGRGPWTEIFVGGWWLLIPLAPPLLSSGFNLWRWVRRAK